MTRAATHSLIVVAAVDAEIAAARKAFQERGVEKLARLVTTGVGKANAARATALALEKYEPDLCIQVGSAGAFRGSGLVPGDVVLATEEVFADEGVRSPEGFLELSQLDLPLARVGDQAVYNRIPVAALSPPLFDELVAELGGRFTVRCGRVATVSTISGTEDAARELELRWEPVAEAMEGAAAALSCYLKGCPFREVRGISNFVGERDRASWDIPTALQHAAEVAAVHLDSLWRSR